VSEDQQPVEIILARGMMSNLITPAFLVDQTGRLVFYNDAAAEMIGIRFEDSGGRSQREWATWFEPLDTEGRPISPEDLPLTTAVRHGRPAYVRLSAQLASGPRRWLDISAFPICGGSGQTGSMVIFWDAGEI